MNAGWVEGIGRVSLAGLAAAQLLDGYWSGDPAKWQDARGKAAYSYGAFLVGSPLVSDIGQS